MKTIEPANIQTFVGGIVYILALDAACLGVFKNSRRSNPSREHARSLPPNKNNAPVGVFL